MLLYFSYVPLQKQFFVSLAVVCIIKLDGNSLYEC